MESLTITIQQHNEDGTIYYLATAPSLPGFCVEGETIDQIQRELPAVLDSFLTCAYEMKTDQIPAPHRTPPIVFDIHSFYTLMT